MEKAYTREQVDYMLKLEYNRGFKDGQKEKTESVIQFLESKKVIKRG